jgi:hypothetical protein
MRRYKIGKWTKDLDVIKNWSKSDFLINNNEISYSLHNQVSLGKLTGRRSISTQAFLYGMLFLYQENPDKKTFRFDHLYKIVKRKQIIIKFLISKKGKEQIIPEAWNHKYLRSNGSFDMEKKISNTNEQFDKEIQKINISKEHLYIALGWLSGTFIEIVKQKKDSEMFAYSGAFPNNGGGEYYQLSKEGKELIEKHLKEGFLI